MATKTPSYLDDGDDGSDAASDKTITQNLHGQYDAASMAHSTLNEDQQTLFPATTTQPQGFTISSLTPHGFQPPAQDFEHSRALSYLSNRQYSAPYDDWDTVVMKNLIVALQVHVHLEDCMQGEVGDVRRTIKVKVERARSELQELIGIPRIDDTDCGLVIVILKAYAKGRENEILDYAMNKESPPPGDSHFNALLLVLMDRFIMFQTKKGTRKISNSSGLPTPKERLEKRRDKRVTDMRGEIEKVKEHVRYVEYEYECSMSPRARKQVREEKVDDLDEEELEVWMEEQPKMWTRVAWMVPTRRLDMSFAKPWFDEEWLTKKLVPRDLWPSEVLRAIRRRERREHDEADALAQQEAIDSLVNPKPETEKPAPEHELTKTNEEQQSSTRSEKNEFNKRQREEDEDSDSEDRSKSQKAEVGTTYDLGDLVFRPKA